MTKCLKLLIMISTLSMLIMSSGHAEQAEYEWVVVIKDPRPARLTGWQRSGYSSSLSYRSALELKRTGKRLAKKHGLEVEAEWFIESLGVYCLIARVKNEQAATLNRLRLEKNVISVQKSNTFELLQTEVLTKSVPDVALDLALHSPPELHLPQSVDGKGIVIALVDSGVDQTHPDLADRVTQNTDLVDDKNKALNGEAHGTAMAGVIIADQHSALGVTGIAPGAELKAYRACWEGKLPPNSDSAVANCNTLSLARALDAIATSSDTDILNLSLSGPKDDLLDQIVAKILSQGVVIVAAYDNKRSPVERFPTISPGIIAVRAESMNQDRLQVFSAPDSKVVAAPQNRANFMQGHSIATAYTSGALALCAQIERDLQKNVCTPEFFERLKQDKNNNLYRLLSKLEGELSSTPID